MDFKTKTLYKTKEKEDGFDPFRHASLHAGRVIYFFHKQRFGGTKLTCLGDSNDSTNQHTQRVDSTASLSIMPRHQINISLSLLKISVSTLAIWYSTNFFYRGSCLFIISFRPHNLKKTRTKITTSGSKHKNFQKKTQEVSDKEICIVNLCKKGKPFCRTSYF